MSRAGGSCDASPADTLASTCWGNAGTGISLLPSCFIPPLSADVMPLKIAKPYTLTITHSLTLDNDNLPPPGQYTSSYLPARPVMSVHVAGHILPGGAVFLRT